MVQPPVCVELPLPTSHPGVLQAARQVPATRRAEQDASASVSTPQLPTRREARPDPPGRRPGFRQPSPGWRHAGDRMSAVWRARWGDRPGAAGISIDQSRCRHMWSFVLPAGLTKRRGAEQVDAASLGVFCSTGIPAACDDGNVAPVCRGVHQTAGAVQPPPRRDRSRRPGCSPFAGRLRPGRRALPARCRRTGPTARRRCHDRCARFPTTVLCTVSPLWGIVRGFACESCTCNTTR